MQGHLLDYLEEAEALVVELYRGAPCLEVALVEPDKGSRAPARCGPLPGVSMLGVSLVGDVNFVSEELVELLEILGDLVGHVGRNILEGQGESEVVSFVGEEGRHAHSRVGGCCCR